MNSVRSRMKSFFFENTSVTQSLLKNTFWIGLSEGLGRIFRAVLFIYMARLLGAGDYGKFSFALAFVSVFVSFFDMGLSGIITREMSRDPRQDSTYPSLFSLKISLGLGTLLIICAGSFLITPDPEIRTAIWILALFSFISQFPEILYAFLRAKQLMQYESWSNMLQVLLITTFGLYVLFHYPSVIHISLSYLLSASAAILIALFFFHNRIFPLRLSIDISTWRRYLAMSWPLAMASLFSMIYGFTDSIIMGYLGQITQTGWYNAALKIVAVTLAPAAIVSLNFFPILSRFAKESAEQFQKVWNYQIGIMIFMAMPVIVGGLSTSYAFIYFLYGADYEPSISVFRILIIMMGTYSIAVTCSQTLIAADHQAKIFWVTVSGAIINTILNLVLIPKYSLYGAAWAAVTSNALMVLIYIVLLLRYTSIKPFNTQILRYLIGSGISCLVMYAVICHTGVRFLHVLLVIMIGAAVYVAVIASGSIVLKKCGISHACSFEG